MKTGKKMLSWLLTVVMALGYVGLLSGVIGRDPFGTKQTACAVTSQGAGTYGWRITVYSRNDTGGWDWENLRVYGKNTNGRGSEVEILAVDNWKVDFNGWRENTFGKGDQWGSTYFPTKVYYAYSFGGGATHRKLDFDLYLDVWNNNTGSWTNVGSMNVYSYEWGNNSGNKTMYVPDGNYPVPRVSISGDDKVYTDGTVQKTYSFGDVKDQYGVNWAFSDMQWKSSHTAAPITNGGVATFGNNSCNDYSVNFTPRFLHSSGDRDANSKTVSVYTKTAITYNLDGGTDPGNPTGYYSDSSPTQLKAPTRAGYEFTG